MAKVKELRKTCQSQWITYTQERGGGTRDPNRHTPEFLEEFINMVEGGVVGGIMPPMGGMGGIPEVEDGTDLVAYVKELQRTNMNAREQWMAFTEAQGSGNRDPGRHTQETLQQFVAHMQSGASLAPEGGMNFGEFIKALQKRSTNFKAAWSQYCKHNAGGKQDPLSHDAGFQSTFFEQMAMVYVKSGAAGATGATPTPLVVAEPAMKKMRVGLTAPAMSAVAAATANPYVEAVKAFQKSGPENKELWSQYTDAYLGGKRDPAKHDPAVLQEFCENHGVPMGAAAAAPAMTPLALMGGGGFGSLFGAKVATPKAAGGFGGMILPGGGGDKAGLVEKIKVFQKGNRENAEVWSSFIGSTRDPNKHEVAKLQEFCATYGL